MNTTQKMRMEANFTRSGDNIDGRRQRTGGTLAYFPLVALAVLILALCGCQSSKIVLKPSIAQPQTMAEFQSLLSRSERPVLAFFVTGHCGSCKRSLPAIARIGDEYADQLVIVRVELGWVGEAVTKYDLRSVPTSIMFLRGEEIGRRRYAAPVFLMRRFIDKMLRTKSSK